MAAGEFAEEISWGSGRWHRHCSMKRGRERKTANMGLAMGMGIVVMRQAYVKKEIWISLSNTES